MLAVSGDSIWCKLYASGVTLSSFWHVPSSAPNLPTPMCPCHSLAILVKLFFSTSVHAVLPTVYRLLSCWLMHAYECFWVGTYNTVKHLSHLEIVVYGHIQLGHKAIFTYSAEYWVYIVHYQVVCLTLNWFGHSEKSLHKTGDPESWVWFWSSVAELHHYILRIEK